MNLESSSLRVAIIVGCTLACGPKQPIVVDGIEEELETQPRTTVLKENGQLEERIDLNGDGFFDVISICIPRTDSSSSEEDAEGDPVAGADSVLNLTCRFDAIMLRKEIDLNWDGEPDRIRYYEDGELLRITNDGDFDGNFEWTDFYQGGTLVLTEKDTDADGEVEIYKNYVAGHVSRIRRDTTGDNLIDLWEYFGPDGELDKVGVDIDGDGIMDIRRE